MPQGIGSFTAVVFLEVVDGGIGAVVAGALGCGLDESEVTMGFRKISLEVGPGLGDQGALSPVLTSIRLHASLEDKEVSS